ncbi:MAG TPA: substrate-binding domain-containing protein [Candidatus Competibacter sp.]|nr:D-xylose transporter subunit XylF [Candidatus Competibacteraceae bacterium]HRE54270.1 substrate-binding domain-containing protein [Candidatus Competibacter sp.]HUM94212.1 substrate-binding domain-containing protein [Candidatus Competibacter sp.]
MNLSTPLSFGKPTFSAPLRILGSFLLAFAALFSSPAARAEGQSVKIGFLLKTMQEERYQTDKAEFIQHAESLGATVLFDSSGNNELTQLQQFEKMLDDGARAIVLQPANTGTAGALVRLANAKGVKVVGYDAMVVNGPLDIMVMQDSWAVGRLQGDAMVRWFQQQRGKVEGKVALIMGQPGDSNAEAMSQGVLNTLQQNPGLRLIAQISHVDWSPDRSAETASNLLVKHKNGVDAFICNNSGLASGVIAALDLENLADANKVFVAGADADLKNIRYLAQGKQAVEVWKPIKPLAHKAAEIAVEIVKNPDAPLERLAREAAARDGLRFAMTDNGFAKIPTVITPVVLIGKDTVDSALIAEKILSREQVYGGKEAR